MTTCRVFALLTMTLVGCTAINAAHTGRRSLVGTHVVDLESCAGLPDRSVLYDRRNAIVEYDVIDTPAGLNVTVAQNLKVGFQPSGEGCHATFRVVDGVVATVHYTGKTTGWGGPDSMCNQLVAECVKRSTRTEMPPGWDWTHAIVSAPARP